ncbi:MAG: hypothetical protein R3C08_11095 [Hyphomonas sp.]
MSGNPEARPSGRDLLARQEASENFELARHGGSWMVVGGFVAASMWIGAAGGVILGFYGVPALLALNPFILAGGAMGIMVPALILIMAGYMGRTNRRASAANALVMQAATRLMAPAREAGTEGITFAEQMKQAASEIDHAMAHALTAMKAMAGEIGDERMRLESVAYASADNARDLTQRLSAERQALEGLARDLRAQLNQMTDAIPRQAEAMVAAARDAAAGISQADEALDNQIQTMRTASEALAARLVDLDNLAREAGARTETLTFAISRIEEKLDQSRRTVDTAVRAGEIAAAAAMTTGDALKDAVSSAIEGARQANNEINQSTRSAAEEAARALARLRQAGQDAAAALRSTEYAARAEVARIDRTAVFEGQRPVAPHRDEPPAVTPAPMRTAAPAPPVTPAQPAAPPRPATPPPVSNGHANGHANGHSVSHGVNGTNGRALPEASARPEPSRPAPAPRPRPPVSSPDDDLFDAAADMLASASLGASPERKGPEPGDLDETLELGKTIDPKDPNPVTLRRRFDDVKDETPATPPHPMRRATDHASLNGTPAASSAAEPPTVVPPGQAKPAQGGEMGWRDIISDMTRDDPLPSDREEVADRLIQRLQSSGIQLPETFKPKMKRRIAEAARKGERQRKAAILEQAGRQVERVTQRLRNDSDLMQLARSFVEMEGDDALNALEQTQGTSRNASPRLAAYLLLDAAL